MGFCKDQAGWDRKGLHWGLSMEKGLEVRAGNWFEDNGDFSLDLLTLRKSQNKTFKG